MSSSNQFKSRNTVPPNNDFERNREKMMNDRPYTSFRSSNEAPKKIFFDIVNENFPTLIPETKSNIGNSCLDFKNASLKEVVKKEENEKLKPGWLYMKYDKNNNILRKHIAPEKPIDNNLLFETQVHNALNQIINNHYKFIEDYGEDSYERDYKMNSYFEMAEEYDDDYFDDYYENYSD